MSQNGRAATLLKVGRGGVQTGQVHRSTTRTLVYRSVHTRARTTLHCTYTYAHTHPRTLPKRGPPLDSTYVSKSYNPSIHPCPCLPSLAGNITISKREETYTEAYPPALPPRGGYGGIGPQGDRNRDKTEHKETSLWMNAVMRLVLFAPLP